MMCYEIWSSSIFYYVQTVRIPFDSISTQRLCEKSKCCYEVKKSARNAQKQFRFTKYGIEKRNKNENTDKEARLGWAGCCEATFAEKIFCLPGT